MKILRLDTIGPAAEQAFRGHEYGADIQDPDGIIVRSHPMKDYPAGERLLAVARAGAGVNNVPVQEYTKRGVVVFNTPGANANAVKELVLCELFLAGRKIVEGATWVQSLKGEGEIARCVEQGKKAFAGREILGKTLGVIGLGAIGAAVANAAIHLGMRVIGYDPYLSVKSAWLIDRRVELADRLDEVFAAADFLTLHVPLTADTEGMLDARALAKCKDGVAILNNARGELVVSADMLNAVRGGKVGRYITDFPDGSMLGVENILCVPHLGASTAEAEEHCARTAARQLVEYLENGNIENGVNYPSVSLPRTSASRVCVHHLNVKEILSKLLAIVSSQGINVAHMADSSLGEYAYLILDLDEAPSAATVELLRGVEGVVRVRVL